MEIVKEKIPTPEVSDMLMSFQCQSIAEDDTEFKIEYDILPPVPLNENSQLSEIQRRIAQGLASTEEQIEALNQQLDTINTKIDQLTNHADGVDYMVAVGSGILTGMIDALFVKEFSLTDANQWGEKKVDAFVIQAAHSQGYEGNDLYGAVKYLEDKFPIAADKATNDFGGGRQHHLRDFSHHPTPVGLIFSLLTQFTENVYGTDVTGAFKIVALNKEDLFLIGKDVPEKLTFGVIHWFFHMVSDMAGSSSSSILVGKAGTGLPGPIGSLLKEVSALPLFRSTNEKGYKEFSVWVSKLFNGTLLGDRDANGNLVPLKFDLRTEIGMAHQLGQQALPVLLNECIVRGFYFIRRFLYESRLCNIQDIHDLKDLNWKNTLPFKNRTITRMLTIATGTFTAVDLGDAAIRSAVKSGGVGPAFAKNFILRVNFVGIGRFAIAIGSDITMEMQRNAAKKKKSLVMSQLIQQSTVKLCYQTADTWCAMSILYEQQAAMFHEQANLWLEVEKTESAMNELYDCMDCISIFYVEMLNKRKKGLEQMASVAPAAAQKIPELAKYINIRR